jgi:uncharacterized protein YukE
VASGGFEVTTSDLDQAAGEFKDQGTAILQAAQQFHSAAALPDSAFGNLPQSKTMASQYQQFFNQVCNDMIKLAEALETGTAKLALNAALYRAADQNAAEQAKQVGG